MKKRTINAFTLVEMLIVIVIIGILIAALMPRMQAAQWRARDVSRKTALSQIQSAIVTSQWDKWRWPGCDTNGSCTSGNAWMDIKDIADLLQAAWMNGVPTDPIQGNTVSWLWTSSGANWEYRYLVATRNGSPNWWFVLMAKTEVEWWSNWVVCPWASDKDHWKISSTDDIAQINICSSVSKVNKDACASEPNCRSNTWTCCYSWDADLRYIVLY